MFEKLYLGKKKWKKSKQTLVVLVFKEMESLKQLIRMYITISTFGSSTYVYKLIAKKEKKMKKLYIV